MPIFVKNKILNWVITGIFSVIGLGILTGVCDYALNFVPEVNFFMEDHEKRVDKIEDNYTNKEYVDDKYDNLNSAISSTNETVKDYAKEDRAFNMKILEEIYAIKYGNNKNAIKLNEALKNIEEVQNSIEPMEFKSIKYLPIDSNITLFPEILDTIFVYL